MEAELKPADGDPACWGWHYLGWNLELESLSSAVPGEGPVRMEEEDCLPGL